MPGARGPEDRIVAAADLGGTRIRLVTLSLDGSERRRLTARAPDLANLPGFLQRLWGQWRIKPGTVEVLVVASRGVWTRGERQQQERRLRRLARSVKVLSDAEAAYLGALGSAPGLLVLAGTGSIVLGRSSRGRWVRRGGLGPLLGDEGSAFWIGREWLRATTRGEDFEPVRRLVGSADATVRIARLAVKVLSRARKGNKVARRIVTEAQRHLASQAIEAARALGLSSPIRVSWAGQLLEDPSFRAGLWRAVGRSGFSVHVIPPREAPVFAAARLAMALRRRQRAGPPGRAKPR